MAARSPLAVASFEDIAIILGERLGGEEAAPQDAQRARADDDIESLRDLASGAPVVRAVNGLLEKAVELRASDIHIEPFRNGLTVRMRIDGLLRAVPAPARRAAAGADFAHQDSRRAQYRRTAAAAGRRGAAQASPARMIDIRVATMPTQHGESAVIRLLPRDRGLLDVAKLGLSRAR